MYGLSKLKGLKNFVLNNNTVYCSIIFASSIENTRFTELIYELIKCENTSTATGAIFLPSAPTKLTT
jgi:hypothetical protein